MPNPPTSPQRILWAQVMSAWAEDDAARRLQLVRKFTEIYPEYLHGWVLLADALTSMARYENARAALSKAEKIATEKEQAIVWAQLGHLHREKGNHPRAELWYTRAVELCPTTQNLCFLGGALGSQGKLESAKRCFIEAIEVATDPPDEANLNLGLIYRTERDYVRAIECFEAALRIDPAYARALEALQSCRKALAASSSH